MKKNTQQRLLIATAIVTLIVLFMVVLTWMHHTVRCANPEQFTQSTAPTNCR